MNEAIKVLLVEDTVEDAELLIREMRKGGLEIVAHRVDTREALARIFHTEAQDEVGGIITSHVESVVETDRRGGSADAKLYRDPSAVCEAWTARN